VWEQESAAAMHAQANPEDWSLRAQLARLRSGRWQKPARLANSRVAQVLGGSLLEYTEYPSLYAPVTEYYLAWQHCAALKTAMAVRTELLNTVVTGLLAPALDRAGLVAGACKSRLAGPRRATISIGPSRHSCPAKRTFGASTRAHIGGPSPTGGSKDTWKAESTCPDC
jgi:hypothetical protein